MSATTCFAADRALTLLPASAAWTAPLTAASTTPSTMNRITSLRAAADSTSRQDSPPLVDGVRHLPGDQHDQPGHEDEDGERAVADDGLDDPAGNEQEEPEQDGQPVQPAWRHRQPDRVVRVVQRERRVHVGEQVVVGVHPAQPAQVAAEEVGREDWQPPGEQSAEPT